MHDITLEDVNRFIRTKTGKADIDVIWKALKGRMDTLTRLESNAFYEGQKVTFTARGVKQEGVIEKVNPKTIKVRTYQGRWNVSPGFLTAV